MCLVFSYNDLSNINLKAGKQDLVEYIDYLTKQVGKDYTIKFIDRLERRVFNLLSEFPNSCAGRDNYRYFVIERYIVIYTVDDQYKKVRIVMFAHQSEYFLVTLKNRL
ncbi:MAG: type II toxin-antitoxin system RelE/ParE family toxin [Magnetococcales bacterium]|nr:type II toxin-antitoxin system RelE/ParE family toxin [Magnetococcales bacterium]